MNILFSPPDITQAEIDEVIDALKSGWITTGPKTKMLENSLSQFTNTKKTVALNSATAALEMCLRLLGVKEGDEVITTAYTYTASASVIHHVGAKIRMVDTMKGSFFMDSEKLSSAINEKTKVIIPVDFAGVPCDYENIYKIVDMYKNIYRPSSKLQEKLGRIAILADCAHALGAEYKGKKTGSIADFSAFSFHAVKNFTTAEGGSLTWRNDLGFDDEKLYRELQLLSLHGQSKDALSKMKLGSWEYDIVAPNFKCNMTDVLASIGIAQLRRYPSLLDRRMEIVKLYEDGLKDLNVTVLKHKGEDFTSSKHLLIVRLNGFEEEQRNEVIRKMAEKGIATNVHYKPLPMHTAYKNLGFDIKDYPNAYDMYKNEITLPLHTLLRDEDVEYITKSLKEVLK